MRLLYLGLLLSGLTLSAFADDLTEGQLKLLKDPAGWDYLKMTDTGMQTEHVCFDGKPHPELCSGRLTLSTANKFEQEVTIKGQGVPRHGTYTLEGDQLVFFDELETRDGPYTIQVDVEKKSLTMDMKQVHIELTQHQNAPPRSRKRKDAK